MTWRWVTLLEGPRRCHRTSRQAQWLIRSHCQLYRCVAADAAAEDPDDDFDRWFTNNIDSRYSYLSYNLSVKNKTIYRLKPAGAQEDACRPNSWVHHAPADSDIGLWHSFPVISAIIQQVQQLQPCRIQIARCKIGDQDVFYCCIPSMESAGDWTKTVEFHYFFQNTSKL